MKRPGLKEEFFLWLAILAIMILTVLVAGRASEERMARVQAEMEKGVIQDDGTRN